MEEELSRCAAASARDFAGGALAKGRQWVGHDNLQPKTGTCKRDLSVYACLHLYILGSGQDGAGQQASVAARLSCYLPTARLQHDADEFTKQAEDFLGQAREARRRTIELDQQLDKARKARTCLTVRSVFAARVGTMVCEHFSPHELAQDMRTARST